MGEGLTDSASIDASIDAAPKSPIKNLGGKRYAADPAVTKRRHGIKCGKLPPGCSYVKGLVTKFREIIEQEVIKRKGEISLFDAALISTACRCEQQALLAGRWLREGYSEMTWDQRLTANREVTKASMERDRTLRLLKVDGSIDETKQKDLRKELGNFYKTPIAGIDSVPPEPEPIV